MDPSTTPKPIDQSNSTMSVEEQCEHYANKTKDLDANLTITNAVLFRNESELTVLELFVRATLETAIDESKTEIYIYCIMFIMGFIGNIFVLISLYKNDRKSRRRENTLFIHLSLIDLLIVIVIVPVEVYWKTTFVWKLGISLCKTFQFLKNYFM